MTRLRLFLVIITLQYLPATCWPSSPASNYTEDQVHLRISRQTRPSCPKRTFRCTNGQCIPFDQECDGIEQCADRSDESLLCKRLRCPQDAFTCAYGACVDGDAKCNGVQDCADNSDELVCDPGSSSGTTKKCGARKFTCDDGQCIDSYSVCDGTAECRDRSDESFKQCSRLFCPEDSFRCSYGACVNGDARCNGVVECVDGSDEARELCGGTGVVVTPSPPTSTFRPTTSGFVTQQPASGCVLPAQPAHGQYSVSSGLPLQPGQIVSDYTLLQYACQSGYATLPNITVVYCINKQWHAELPQCVPTCPSRVSSSVDIKCSFDGIEVDCSKPMLPGTIATMKCKHFYENQGSSTPTIICKDGSWDLRIMNCVPECGKIINKATPLIVNGQVAQAGQFPWLVAVYKNVSGSFTQICGGSIISQKVVVSAAHCFAALQDGRVFDKDLFMIGAGKYYRALNDPKDIGSQLFQLEKLFVPVTYRGVATRYDSDYALLVVKGTISITSIVQPVCVDWSNDLETEFLTPGTYGTVAGWGLIQERGQMSEVVRTLNVPVIDYTTCFNDVPQDFQQFISKEKICAGYLNGSSVCQGDSGGGLVFKHVQGRITRYYLQGLVSNGPFRDNSCNSEQYSLYTKISTFVKELQIFETKNRPLDNEVQ